MKNSTSIQPMKFRISKARYPISQQEWGLHKAEIEKLYAEDELKNIMQYMSINYEFTATERQWKVQLKKWKFKKRIQGSDYKGILKKKKQRERERPGVPTEFFIRGERVPDAKIMRYEYEARRKGRINDDEASSVLINIETPPGLSYGTPRSYTESQPSSPIENAIETRVFEQSSEEAATPTQVSGSAKDIQDNETIREYRASTQSPPLAFFYWWHSFEDFSNRQPLSSFNVGSTNATMHLLGSVAIPINSYETECIYDQIRNQWATAFKCIGCQMRYIFSDIRTASGLENGPSGAAHMLISAFIQTLYQKLEVSEYLLALFASSIGSILHYWQLYPQAYALLQRVIQVTANNPDFRIFCCGVRIHLAAYFIQENRFEEAERLLFEAFGPWFHRLAIIHWREFCQTHTPRTLKSFIGKVYRPMNNFPVIFDFGLWNTSDQDDSDDYWLEIPAGTLCLEEEILPFDVNIQDCDNYSNIFFSTVFVTLKELELLQIAGEVVRELHRRDPTRCGVFIELETCQRIRGLDD